MLTASQSAREEDARAYDDFRILLLLTAISLQNELFGDDTATVNVTIPVSVD